MNILSIEKDPKLDSIVVVTAEDGAQMRYRMDPGGVLRPGRVWSCSGPRTAMDGHGDYTVTVFIPLPDGCPEILKVEAH